MVEVYITGVAATGFQRWPDRDHRSLGAEVVEGVLADAGREDGQGIDEIWFANCALGTWGQANIRGQVVLDPLLRSGRLVPGTPIANVEGGCATGSVAFHSAVRAVAAGGARTALAVGVEKVFVPDAPQTIWQLFLGGLDQLHPHEWQDFLATAPGEGGEAVDLHPHRLPFLDVHAVQARRHMTLHGTTAEHLAVISSKNHRHGSLNPKAQHGREMSVAEILGDKPIVAPFTRSMCAPISDGAAAVLVSRDRPTDRPAIRVRASVLTGGTWRGLDAPSVVAHSATRAWAAAGMGPADIQLAELHDATAWCELHATEALGFCERGQGGAYAASGATSLGGERPINTSGGLASKGHPLGATGLGMLEELVVQLRGEAGPRQAGGAPSVALQQNAGGMIGFDEALSHIGVLERIG